MDQQPKPRPSPAEPPPVEQEIQQSGGRSIVKDEHLKRVIKQHPQRDEPRVDSVEPGETPAP
ncbi:MAG TPA: hypothetical protein VMT83_18780 [Burkholderiaceae bacterium]|nr:hypothetical protein [Burkholderiaceae bacterium]